MIKALLIVFLFFPAKESGIGHAANYNEFAGEGAMRNIEMELRFNNGGWFTNQGYPNDDPNNTNVDAFWDHGHFQTVALPYTARLYQYLIREGKL